MSQPDRASRAEVLATVRSHPRLGALPPLPRIPVRESGGAVQVFMAVAPRERASPVIDVPLIVIDADQRDIDQNECGPVIRVCWWRRC